MLRPLLLVALLALLGGCASEIAPMDTEPGLLVVRGGTSFGMCVGYCVTELRIDGREIVFTETSRDPKQPPRVRKLPITPAEWQELAALAAPGALAPLAEVYGCPDCADGGAEWIEVEREGRRKRVTFEYRKPPPAIAALAAEIGEIRARLR